MSTRQLSSSILLWVRTDQPRETGMDYWRGPHAKIISASKGVKEYRQIHLASANPGRWPTTPGVETEIPLERRVDGVAEVTFQSVLSPLRGRRQTRLAHRDEVNVFRRTLLYLGPPYSSRWHEVAPLGEPVGARALVHLRRREGVRARDFRTQVTALVNALVGTGSLTELRIQTFLPWVEKLWDTPEVAHDNPAGQRIHASLTLGLTDPDARTAFFESPELRSVSETLAPVVSAIHAYDVSETLTFVKDGVVQDAPVVS